MHTLPYKVSKVLGWLRDPAHRKWVMVAVTAVVVIASLLLARHWRSQAQEAAVEAEVANRGVEVLTSARDADSKAQASLGASKAAIDTNERVHRGITEDALQQHQDWANEPVPDDVLRSLRD